MNDRDKRSRGIKILLSDVFAMIEPTTPFKLAKHTVSQNRFFTVNMQENQTNEVVMQADCSVH